MSDIPAHTHSGGKCPVTGASGANPHAFCPPQQGDFRAPCPAMNSMANHGYLPRDGQCVNAKMIVAALQACFKLSKPLAWFLTHGALLLLDQGSGNFDLHDLARHNKIEHNASLYHDDAGEREEYAPITIDENLLKLVFEDSADGVVMTPEDVARVRVRREATSHPPIDFIHAELARGEISIVLNMFNNPSPALHSAGIPLQHRSAISRLFRRLVGKKDSPETTQLDGVPIERMRYWFQHERLPEDWTPYHKTTLRETITTINRLRSTMRQMAKEKKKQAKRLASAPAPAPTTAEAAEVEVKVDTEPEVLPELEKAAKSESDTSSDTDDTSNTLEVPPSHPRNASGSSTATSSTFPDTPLHTPGASEFEPITVDPKSDLPLRLEVVGGKGRFEEEFDAVRVGIMAA